MGESLSRWLRALQPSTWRWIAALLVMLLAAVGGAQLGLGAALLVLAAGTLLGGVLIFWSSLQGLAGDTPLTLDEAMSLAAPSAEEEQKQAVLRALKDLEYERSVGKISEEDYQELSRRYRAEAKALLLMVDRDLRPALAQAEALLAKRLSAAGVSAVPADAAHPSVEPATAQTLECTKCKAQNDPDARFCKSCGQALAEPEGSP